MLLDSHPDNELGKGTLPNEAELIARGYVFAMTVKHDGGSFVMRSKRCVSIAGADAFQDARQMLANPWVEIRLPSKRKSVSFRLSVTANSGG